MIKGLICIFALKAIQNGEIGFKTQSYEKVSYLGSQLPRLDSQIFRNSGLNLCHLRLYIQNLLTPICLDDSKLSPRQSTHKDNQNRLLTSLVLNKIQELKNEYLYRTRVWLGDFHKSSPKNWNKIWKKKYFPITIKLVFSERYASKASKTETVRRDCKFFECGMLQKFGLFLKISCTWQ